jgi:ribosomal protein L37AE/L43A
VVILYPNNIKYLYLLTKADDDIECDFCGRDPSDYNVSVWSDRACDFDMCNACYQRYSSFWKVEYFYKKNHY